MKPNPSSTLRALPPSTDISGSQFSNRKIKHGIDFLMVDFAQNIEESKFDSFCTKTGTYFNIA